MQFNLNKFLISISFALDYAELGIIDHITNHSRRVGYLAFKIGQELGFSSEDLFDLMALAILHDNGAVQSQNSEAKSLAELEKIQTHCIIGETNINKFPFFKKRKNIILYHHENQQGTGFFSKKGSEIPLMAEIISFADLAETTYSSVDNQQEARTNILANRELYSKKIITSFQKAAQQKSFWLNLDDRFILTALAQESPQFTHELTYQELHKLTEIFSTIVDGKSPYTANHSQGLSQKIAKMVDYYGYDHVTKYKLIIAADLHDIGKLALSNEILNKRGKLTKYEFEKIKEHTYYTRRALEGNNGFKEITEWAANHHEKLDGSGYPFGKDEADLDFNSQLMACLDIYQALTEHRPYRNRMSHQQAVKIMFKMVHNKKINGEITKDIDQLFG